VVAGSIAGFRTSEATRAKDSKVWELRVALFAVLQRDLVDSVACSIPWSLYENDQSSGRMEGTRRTSGGLLM
jgi:hypothetical protein